MLVGITTAAVIGSGWLTYRYFAKPVFLTVAAGSADGEALSLISAISARLAASNSHVRLKVADSGTSAKASQMMAAGKVDLAIVRGDTSGLSDARSVLLLTHGVVMILASPSVSADSLGDLRNTTIGVIGGAINQPVVEALKQVYQFDRAKVQFQDVAITGGAAALSSGQVHALLAVVPLTEKYLAKVRQFFQQAGAKGAAPKLIEIESAGAVANVAQYYESYDIPKGTLRGAPPVPSDDLTSLRVSFFLVADKSVDADSITDLTQSLIGVRRDLLSEYPILAQAGAPSTDADALIPIHPGAATYYGGNQQSFLNKYDDKIYYASLPVFRRPDQCRPDQQDNFHRRPQSGKTNTDRIAAADWRSARPSRWQRQHLSVHHRDEHRSKRKNSLRRSSRLQFELSIARMPSGPGN